jgi:hypothetical protein
MKPTNNLKKYNHEVSKCLLASWIDESGKSPGHHYFDIQSQKAKFEVGRRAKFAASEYLYMPINAKDERDQSLEDWLSIDESGLGLLCKAAHNNDPSIMPVDNTLAQRALRACVSLGLRSAYQFYMIAQIPGLSDRMGTTTSHQSLAKNAFRAIQARFLRFSNWDFKIFFNSSVHLLIGEQPFRDWSLRDDLAESITMPLSPTALLVGTPPSDRNQRHMSLAWYSAPGRPTFAEMHNDFVVKTARQWIVASSAAQLMAVTPLLSLELVRERIAKDRIVIL